MTVGTHECRFSNPELGQHVPGGSRSSPTPPISWSCSSSPFAQDLRRDTRPRHPHREVRRPAQARRGRDGGDLSLHVQGPRASRRKWSSSGCARSSRRRVRADVHRRGAAASRLNHANVVQIFDFDKHEDTYYLAMEYVRGQSLWDLRKRAGSRACSDPPMLVAHIGAEVARGLQYAHRLVLGRGAAAPGAPGRHAAQRAAVLRRRRQAHRLRHRQARATSDPAGGAQGQVRVHVPGAGARRGGGRAHGRLRARRGALGDAHRRPAVRRGPRRGRAPGGAGERDRSAGPPQPGRARGAGRGGDARWSATRRPATRRRESSSARSRSSCCAARPAWTTRTWVPSCCGSSTCPSPSSSRFRPR